MVLGYLLNGPVTSKKYKPYSHQKPHHKIFRKKPTQNKQIIVLKVENKF
jgi:hypothetical protein